MKLLGLTACLGLLACACACGAAGRRFSWPAAAVGGADSGRLFRIVEGGKYGFIDRKGRVVVEPRFDDAEEFSEGLALVSLNGRKVFIDATGAVVVAPEDFEPINGFTDGLARGNITSGSSHTKGYIDKTGRLAIGDLGVSGACDFSEGLACVQGAKWGFIDTTGRYVIERRFDEVGYFREGMSSVTFWDRSGAPRHKQGFIDKTGRVVVEPRFDLTQSFSEGLAAVGELAGETGGGDYRFGFIDKTGAVVIKPQFDWAVGFGEGLAAVRVGGRWGYVDKSGGWALRPRFDKAEHFSEGLAAVAVGGKWGYIDRAGAFVIEPRFNEARPFQGGMAFVKVGGHDADASVDVVGGLDTAGEWGYIDRAGGYIWEPTH